MKKIMFFLMAIAMCFAVYSCDKDEAIDLPIEEEPAPTVKEPTFVVYAFDDSDEFLVRNLGRFYLREKVWRNGTDFYGDTIKVGDVKHINVYTKLINNNSAVTIEDIKRSVYAIKIQYTSDRSVYADSVIVLNDAGKFDVYDNRYYKETFNNNYEKNVTLSKAFVSYYGTLLEDNTVDYPDYFTYATHRRNNGAYSLELKKTVDVLPIELNERFTVISGKEYTIDEIFRTFEIRTEYNDARDGAKSDLWRRN
jgi:hypothetical protein